MNIACSISWTNRYDLINHYTRFLGLRRTELIFIISTGQEKGFDNLECSGEGALYELRILPGQLGSIKISDFMDKWFFCLLCSHLFLSSIVLGTKIHVLVWSSNPKLGFNMSFNISISGFPPLCKKTVKRYGEISNIIFLNFHYLLIKCSLTA